MPFQYQSIIDETLSTTIGSVTENVTNDTINLAQDAAIQSTPDMVRTFLENNIFFKFLAIKLVDTNFVHIDIWSFVHFFVVFALAAFLFRIFSSVNPIKIGFAVLITIIVFEVLEFILRLLGFVAKESFIDILWDIIMGTIAIPIAFIGFLWSGLIIAILIGLFFLIRWLITTI